MQLSSILNILLAGAAVLASTPTVDAGDFQDGFEDGKLECEALFSGEKDDCWNIEQLCTNELLDDEDWFAGDSSDSPSDKSYKRGGKKGVAHALREIEAYCFKNDVSQCNDLGENAAEMIAFDHCEIYASHGGNGKNPSYKAQCRDEAIDVCRGNIIEKINHFCPGEDVSYEELREAKSECEETVNELIGSSSSTRNLKMAAPKKKATPKKTATKKKAAPKKKTAPKKKAAPKKKTKPTNK